MTTLPPCVGEPQADAVDATLRAAARPGADPDATIFAAGAPGSADMPPGTADLRVVERAHYDFAGTFAQGGVGRISRARDAHLGRAVAVKELLSSSPAAEQRFVREALLTARLQHPGILPIYEAGRWPSGEPFYAMKLVSGKTLASVLGRARSLAQRLALLPHVLAVAETIAYAHSEGIIHRDIKPSNVLIGPFGETLVIDWGLAKDLRAPDDDAVLATAEGSQSGFGRALGQSAVNQSAVHQSAIGRSTTGSSGSHDLTMYGEVLGTPGYMAPEQAAGLPVNERADIYALGAVLYRVLAGVEPYTGESAVDILNQVIAGPPPALERRVRGLPDELVTIVRTAMARSPGDRYPTAKALADDLRRFQTGQIVGVHRYSSAALLRRWARRWRAPLAVAAAGVLAMSVLAVVSFREIIVASQKAEEQKDNAMHAKAAAERARALSEEHRARAEQAQREAERRADNLLLEQARAAVGRDPNDAIALLRQLSPAFTDWGAARTIAGDARASGLAAVLRGHTDTISRVTFAPDGRSLVTTSDDHTARVWDLSTGTSRALVGHGDEVYRAAFAPDGRRVATSSRDGTVRVWDLRSGASQVLAGDRGATHGVAFLSADRVAASTAEHEVRAWDLRTGVAETFARCDHRGFSADARHVVCADQDRPVQLFDLATGAVETFRWRGVPKEVAVAPDGRRLAVGDLAGNITLFDVETGQRRELVGHAELVRSMVFSPDGALLASGSRDKTVRLWDAATGEARVLHGHEGLVVRVVFAPDGATLASASSDHSVRLWDVRTGHARALVGFDDAVQDVAFSPDGALIAAASADFTARVWRAQPVATRVLTGHDSPVIAAAFAPDGATLATGDRAGALRLWDLASGASVPLVGHLDRIFKLRFTPDGSRLVSASDDGVVRLWTRAGELTGELAAPSSAVREFVLASDGQALATAWSDGQVRWWDVGRDVVDTLAVHAAPVLSLALASDGGLLASGDEAGEVRVWRRATGETTVLRGHTGEVGAMLFTRDDATLITGSVDHAIRLWDLDAGTSTEFRGSGSGVRGIVLLADDRRIVTRGEENAVRIFDVLTGEPLAVLRGHEAPPVRIDASDATIATAGIDNTVRLWDLESGEMRVLRGHTEMVCDLAFAPDGRTLASTSLDHTVRLWTDDLPHGPDLRAWLADATGGTRPLDPALPDPTAAPGHRLGAVAEPSGAPRCSTLPAP